MVMSGGGRQQGTGLLGGRVVVSKDFLGAGAADLVIQGVMKGASEFGGGFRGGRASGWETKEPEEPAVYGLHRSMQEEQNSIDGRARVFVGAEPVPPCVWDRRDGEVEEEERPTGGRGRWAEGDCCHLFVWGQDFL